MTNYVKVLQIKYFGEQWSITGNDYKTLEWYGTSTKPTQPILDSLWAEVQVKAKLEADAKLKAEEACDRKRQEVLDRLGITAEELKTILT